MPPNTIFHRCMEDIHIITNLFLSQHRLYSVAGPLSDMEHILSRDPIMKRLIDRYGKQTLAESDDLFADLTRSITGQQLSGKAAGTIWKRVTALLDGKITPSGFLTISDEQLRGAGLSSGKTRYIKGLAAAIDNRTLDLELLRTLDDEKVIEQLTKIKGIGRWTAEMFLIFSLARPDVFSFGDGGLGSAIKRLYNNGEELDRNMITEISGKWRPWRSYASLYLWESIDNG